MLVPFYLCAPSPPFGLGHVNSRPDRPPMCVMTCREMFAWHPNPALTVRIRARYAVVMNKQRVYRAGSMTPVEATGKCYGDITLAADAECPHPTPRNGALFATPTLPGVVRWVMGNDMCGYETRVREITVDADTTYVYRVSAWESVSWSDKPAEVYWSTGVTLTDWYATADTDGLDATNWEVLIAPENVLAVRNVSAKRMLVAAGDRTLELKRIITRGWKCAA